MRWLLACLVLLVGAETSASIIVTRDSRVIDSQCFIKANEDTLLGDVRPPEPPDDWTAEFTICGTGIGTMTSLIDSEVLSVDMSSQFGNNSSFREDVTVFFELDFVVTEPSLAEWIDGSGTRVEALVPGTTYTISDFVHATSLSQGRLERSASVRLIPEPGTLGLLSLGIGALGARSLLPERRLPASDVR